MLSYSKDFFCSDVKSSSQSLSHKDTPGAEQKNCPSLALLCMSDFMHGKTELVLEHLSQSQM